LAIFGSLKGSLTDAPNTTKACGMALSKCEPSRVIVLDLRDFRINANVCSPLKSPAIEPDDEEFEDFELEREMYGAAMEGKKRKLKSFTPYFQSNSQISSISARFSSFDFSFQIFIDF
jgi:hypothetical protein